MTLPFPRVGRLFARRVGRYGFTLVEALSTVCMLGIFLVVLFLTVSWGFRSFSLAVAKSDVTTEARRLALFVERELRSSTYFSVYVQERVAGGERRDAVCFVSRDDWSDPAAFDTLKGMPAWNRYFIYYATTDLPFGRFNRVTIHPQDPSDIGSFPYPGFVDTPQLYTPDNVPSSSQPDIDAARCLASSVQSFKVTPIPTTQELDFRLLLRQNGLMARRATGAREGGTFELKYRVQPQNTL
jgi:hypothetical protein